MLRQQLGQWLAGSTISGNPFEGYWSDAPRHDSFTPRKADP
jgi:hypothetical protein